MVDEKYYFRDFLNPKEGTALIETTFRGYGPDEYSSSSFEGNLTLKDCYRQMNLEFYASNEEGRFAALHKINAIIREATVIKNLIESFEFKPKLEKKTKKKGS